VKISILSVLVLVLGLLASACSGAPPANASNASPEPAAVEDQASLVTALEAAGQRLKQGTPSHSRF
jgi:hypothetical protein